MPKIKMAAFRIYTLQYGKACKKCVVNIFPSQSTLDNY